MKMSLMKTLNSGGVLICPCFDYCVILLLSVTARILNIVYDAQACLSNHTVAQ